jgi:hypothetical protein
MKEDTLQKELLALELLSMKADLYRKWYKKRVPLTIVLYGIKNG